MKKILLIFPPLCSPAMPPYSVAGIYSFLQRNLDLKEFTIEILDLNIEYHNLKFPNLKRFFSNDKKWNDYNNAVESYEKGFGSLIKETKKDQQAMLNLINKSKPEIIAFSLLFSSQSFFTKKIIQEIKKIKGVNGSNISTIVGGPAVDDEIVKCADHCFQNPADMVMFLEGKRKEREEIVSTNIVDFSKFDLGKYFSPSPIIPIKTSSGCYYNQCVYCSHSGNMPYFEFPIEDIKKSIKESISSGATHFFVVDELISKKRLIDLGKIFIGNGIKWMCQLRPVKDLDYETLKFLRKSGLDTILWGVESGSQKILDKMRKGTIIKDIEKVLLDSHKAGIKNIVYLILGFPTETKEDFIGTIKLIEKNRENIDLVSLSLFELNKWTYIYDHPDEFGVNIRHEGEKTNGSIDIGNNIKDLSDEFGNNCVIDGIKYSVIEGISQEQAQKLEKEYRKRVSKINKLPEKANLFREHLLFF